MRFYSTYISWNKAGATNPKGTIKQSNRVHSGTSLFTGVMKCPQCGARMAARCRMNKQKDGTRETIEYYACGAWKKKGKSVCHSNGMRADKAEVYIFDRSEQLATNE